MKPNNESVVPGLGPTGPTATTDRAKAIRQIESAFSFIKQQVANQLRTEQRLKRVRTAFVRRGLALSTMTILSIALVLPGRSQSADSLTIEPAQTIETQEVWQSSVHLDKQSSSLLVIEDNTPEIKVGKSLAQEQAEARRRLAYANQTRLQSVARPEAFKTISAEEAHRLAQDAAAKAGIPEYWKELAAVWQVESGKLAYGCVNGGGAVGPMQFLPSTFRSHATDGDGDGNADICNAKDALVSAGKLLKDAGIEDNTDQAIHSYNHSMAYVNKVKRVADSIN